MRPCTFRAVVGRPSGAPRVPLRPFASSCCVQMMQKHETLAASIQRDGTKFGTVVSALVLSPVELLRVALVDID
jgi:hypothetical protein